MFELPYPSFESLSDDELIKVIGENFDYELEHLKRAIPSVEAASVSDVADQQSPSFRLYGTEYPEVNRTLVSILSLKWILSSNYDAFTEAQNGPPKLMVESFRELTNQFKRVLTNQRDIYLLLVSTIVADIGKDSSLAVEVKARVGEVTAKNHDQLVYNAAKAHIIHCLEQLSSNDRRDVMLGLQFAAELNIPQLSQAENVPGSLLGIATFRSEPRAVRLKMLEVLLDVSGAAAQASHKGSLVMTEPVYQTYISTFRALSEYIGAANLTEIQCYDMILHARATLLRHYGHTRLLSTANKGDRALLRFLCMGRVATVELAQLFEEAFDDLGDAQSTAIEHLNFNGVSTHDRAVIPYYAPALFARIVKLAKDDFSEATKRDKWLREALTILMRFLSRVCQPDDEAQDCDSFVEEHNLSFALDTIINPSFKQNPEILDSLRLPWVDRME